MPAQLRSNVLLDLRASLFIEHVYLGQQNGNVRRIAIEIADQFDIPLRKWRVDGDGNKGQTDVGKPLARSFSVVGENAFQSWRIDKTNPAKLGERWQFDAYKGDVLLISRIPAFIDILSDVANGGLFDASIHVSERNAFHRTIRDLCDN